MTRLAARMSPSGAEQKNWYKRQRWPERLRTSNNSGPLLRSGSVQPFSGRNLAAGRFTVVALSRNGYIRFRPVVLEHFCRKIQRVLLTAGQVSSCIPVAEGTLRVQTLPPIDHSALSKRT
jgi:hypothetical protein